MAAGGGLRRLLRVRELEENLSRVELESALAGERKAAEAADSARELLARGRRSFADGVKRGDGVERAGALLAIDAVGRMRPGLQVRLEEANAEVARQREDFLNRRTERKQAESLLEASRREAAAREARRAQQRLDDWFGRRGRGRRPDGADEA